LWAQQSKTAGGEKVAPGNSVAKSTACFACFGNTSDAISAADVMCESSLVLGPD